MRSSVPSPESVCWASGGLIVTPSALASVHRERIIAQAARHKLPAIYPFRYFVSDGGLIYYGPNPVDQFRRAASYVDRILKGEKPADLPVQNPTKRPTRRQSQNRESSRHYCAADAARPC